MAYKKSNPNGQAVMASSEPVVIASDQSTLPVSIASTVPTDPIDDPTRDNGKVDVASLDQYTPVSGRLPVDGSGVTQPVSIAGTVATDPTDDPTRDNGKIDVASLDQYTPVSGRLPVDGSGVTQPISEAPSAISATTADATASGDNTVVSITNNPRLYYISLSANGANSADVTAIVKIGATSKYKVSLKAGAIWARNVGAGRNYITGASGEDIIVNLSAAQTVHVSVEYADA